MMHLNHLRSMNLSKMKMAQSKEIGLGAVGEIQFKNGGDNYRPNSQTL
jgi:hypothetical protein